jgi:hypothetical protein
MKRTLVLLACLVPAGYAQAAAICDARVHFESVAGTECLNGSPSGFDYLCQAAEGAPAPLVVYFDGGGACWDGNTCDCRPCVAEDSRPECAGVPPGVCSSGYIAESSPGYERAGAGLSFSDSLQGYTLFTSVNSPFRTSWNYAFIAYCTGDLHAGNAAQSYTTTDHRQGYACFVDSDCRDPMTGASGPAGSCEAGFCKDVTYSVKHKGYANAAKILDRIAALFPAPAKVAAFSGYGVDCNLKQVRERYPEVRMYEMNTSGPPINPRYMKDFLADTISWGGFHFASDGTVISDTCPIESPDSILAWSPISFSYYNQIHFPDVRKAAAISRFDQELGAFACAWGATPDAGGSCQWVVADSISDLFTSYLVSRQKSFNYKIYAATTDCHGFDAFDPSGHCDFDTIKENGVKFSDWVNAWMEQPSPVQWKNVVEPGRVPVPAQD